MAGPLVLNAYRRHCGGHGPGAVAARWAHECSTPIGVTAEGTSWRHARSRMTSSAQRLSASLRRAPEINGGNRVAHKCSTPIGVTAEGTRRAGQRRYTGFRAQRLSASLRRALAQHLLSAHPEVCSTPIGVTAEGTRPPRWARPRWNCAQRLSASLRRARTLTPRAPGRMYMCSTPIGVTAEGTVPHLTRYQKTSSNTTLQATSQGTQGPPPWTLERMRQ